MALIQALGWMGEAAAPAVQPLVQLAFGREDNVKWLAVESLTKIGAPAALALGEKVTRGSADEREFAINLLVGMGPKGRAAHADLLSVLDQLDGEALLEAVHAVTATVDTDPGPDAAANAYRTLRATPELQAVSPRVLRLTRSQDRGLATGAVKVLGAFDVPLDVTVPIIIRHPIREQEWLERTGEDPAGHWGKAIASLYALHGLGPAAVPELIKALEDPDPRVPVSATTLLRTSNLARPDDVPSLSRALRRSPDPSVRRTIADILTELNSAADRRAGASRSRRRPPARAN